MLVVDASYVPYPFLLVLQLVLGSQCSATAALFTAGVRTELVLDRQYALRADMHRVELHLRV